MLFVRKIFVCTAIFSFLFSHTAENVPLTLHDPLCRAMQATGAQLGKAYVTGRVKIALPKNSGGELRRFVEEAGTALGNREETAEMRESSCQSSVCLSFNGAARQNVIYARQATDAAPDEENTEFVIHVIKENPAEEEIALIKEEILAILQKKHAGARISTCLEGYLDGKLRKDEWAYCLQDAFEAVGAKTLTKTWAEQYVSYTGYSPLLEAQENGINVNIAMRYHAFDGRTYVSIGSPLLTIEY